MNGATCNNKRWLKYQACVRVQQWVRNIWVGKWVRRVSEVGKNELGSWRSAMFVFTWLMIDWSHSIRLCTSYCYCPRPSFISLNQILFFHTIFWNKQTNKRSFRIFFCMSALTSPYIDTRSIFLIWNKHTNFLTNYQVFNRWLTDWVRQKGVCMNVVSERMAGTGGEARTHLQSTFLFFIVNECNYKYS